MVTEESFETKTVSDYRQAVRSLTESDSSGGYLPLRKYEKHRAYYCLTGEKIGGSPSNGEVSYKLILLLEQEYHLDKVRTDDGRDPWDAGGPLTKDELSVLVEALQEAADG